MKVLFLSAWYPNRNDAMAGLFVRKHALAVSQFAQVCVVFPCTDTSAQGFQISEQDTGDLHEIFVYYAKPKMIFGKAFAYVWAFLKGYKFVKGKYGKPDVCTANILTRCGVLAYMLRLFCGIPYVVIEHWSRYLRNDFTFNGILHKHITKIVARNAKAILPISPSLKNALQQLGLSNNRYIPLNNVVDDFFYQTERTPKARKIILHITCFDERAKNTCGLLRAIKEITLHRNDFTLVIVGNGNDFKMVKDYADSLGLNEGTVDFVGEKTPHEVAEWFAASSFLVLPSHFEVAPVIVSESLASGCPVLSTHVGFVLEVIDNECGVVIPVDDELALCQKLDWMLDHFTDFDERTIRTKAEQFRFNVVGKQLVEIYNGLL